MKKLIKQTPKSHILLLLLLLLQILLIFYTPYAFSWDYNPGILFVSKFSPTIFCAIEAFLLYFGTQHIKSDQHSSKNSKKHFITIIIWGCIAAAMIIASQFHATADFLQLPYYKSYIPLLTIYMIIALVCWSNLGYILISRHVEPSVKNLSIIIIVVLNCTNATIRRWFYVYDNSRYYDNFYTILLPILVGVLVVAFFKLKPPKANLE